MKDELYYHPYRILLLICYLGHLSPSPGFIMAAPEVGSIDSEFTVEQGTARLQLAIPTPSPMLELLPRLGLLYSSSSDDNSYLGYGWSLMGISTITRCSHTVEQDGYIRGVEMDNLDAFCLDGQRLFSVGNREYRTEIDSYKKVVSHGVSGNGPLYFTVFTKENVVMSFGSTVLSRHKLTGDSTIYGWYLSEIKDYANNTVEFKYKSDGFSPLLSTISMRSAKLNFYYASRPDEFVKYRNGNVLLNQKKRLTNIVSTMSGQPFRNLNIRYQEGKSSHQSIVSEVELCSRKKCTDDVDQDQFNIKKMNQPKYWSHEYGWNAGWRIESHPRFVNDVNGDGLADIIGFASTGVHVALNNGKNGFSPSKNWIAGFGTSTGGWSVQLHPRFVTDVNGDGLPDVVGFAQSGVHVSLNTGKETFAGSTLWTSQFCVSNGWQVSHHPRFLKDMNGDGLPDIVGFANQGVYVGLNDGTKFKTGTRWIDKFGYGNGWRIETHPRFIEDINGDGLPDVVGFADDGVYIAINSQGKFINYGRWLNAFGPSTGGWSVAHHPRFVIDVNLDGLADIVGFADAGVYVSLSTGKSLLPATQWISSFGRTSGGWRVNEHPRSLQDMNGDGLPDIVGFASSGVYIALNTGSSFQSPIQWVAGYGTVNGWTINSHPRFVTDINGDGMPDIVGFANSGVYVSTNLNQKLKMIETNDGVQKIKKITYSYTSVTSVYKQSEMKKPYPNIQINFGQQVVRTVEVSNGIGGFNTTTYNYRGNVINMRGRGNLGFEEITLNISPSGEKSIFTYHQIFPFTGLQKTTSTEINGLKIQNTDLHYSQMKHYNVSKVVQIRLDRMMKHDFQMSNTPLRTEDTLFKNVDIYGNVFTIEKSVTGPGQTFFETTRKQFITDKERWYINRLTEITVEHQLDHNIKRRTTTFKYNQVNRRLNQQITEPNSVIGLRVSYHFDVYGNIISKTESPVIPNAKALPRIIQMTYDNDGFFMTSLQNGLGHVENYKNDKFGNRIQLIGANGFQTTFDYDDFDRKIRESHSDGTYIEWKYVWDKSLPLSKYKIVKKESGKPFEEKMYDSLDRIIRFVRQDFYDQLVSEDFVYDSLGRIVKQSTPYKVMRNISPKWLTFTYDKLGRELSSTKPHCKETYVTLKTIYDKNIITKFDEVGGKTTSIFDAMGRIMVVSNTKNDNMTYIYDPLGYLTLTKDPFGNSISVKYDIFGNKVVMSDPDMGNWKYQYNAFGELIRQIDAVGNVMEQSFDKLGRISSRSEKEGTTNWTYDTTPNGIGKVAKVTSPNMERRFTYDSYGRENTVSTIVENEMYQIRTKYDTFSRIESQEYPGSKSIYYCHSITGYLTAVTNIPCTEDASKLTSNNTYWQALDYNQDGQLVAEKMGNGLITKYVYDEGRHLSSITTTNKSKQTVRHFEYTHDLKGNVKTRKDLAGKETTYEQFDYDNLDRIIRATLYSSHDLKNKGFTEDWQYDAIGNIIYYSEIGGNHFKYHKTKPHAVIKAGINTYSYDENGNLITKNGQSIEWTSFHKIKSITMKNEESIRFTYDSDRNKITKTTSQDTTVYIGKAYEKIKRLNSGKSEHKYLIYALGKVIAIETNDTVSYLHTDHLDSVDTLTSENGDILESVRYNAFGQRRLDKWIGSVNDKTKYSTKRGYTGHEHLSEVELIDMNGRVYDPLIGRFLSPDPHIQDPYNLQSFNRYSYVINNPLKLKDPSGYFFKALKRVFKKIWRPVLAIAVSVVTLGAAAPIAAGWVAAMGISGALATVASGAIAGAASGFMGGTIMTGNIKGGLQGALGGAITGGIAGHFNGAWSLERVGSNALAGGTVSELTGGKFKDGFILAGVTSSARYLYNTAVKYDVTWKSGGAAVIKCESCLPVAGANNIGTQGHTTLNPGGWFNEGGIVSRMANRIPGVNSVAGLHDFFQVTLDRVPIPSARDIFNIPGMPVAAAISYGGLLDGAPSAVLIVDKSRRKG